MDDLCPRRVWGFSTGHLLAPRGWTLDVSTHHLDHTRCRSGADQAESGLSTACTASPPSGSSFDTLPRGASSNTARFEHLDEGGATLHVTELFLPHPDPETTTARTVAASPGSDPHWWSARRLQHLLHPKVTSSAPGAGAPPRVWVVEVTPAVSVSEADSEASAACASSSLASAVTPFARLFVEVVWDARALPRYADAVVDDAVRRILEHLVRLYNMPALQLDGFLCFTRKSIAETAAVAESPVTGTTAARVSPQTAKAMHLQPSAATPQLREPCAPYALADMGNVTISALWGLSLYCAPAAAYVRLLLPCARGEDGEVRRWCADLAFPSPACLASAATLQGFLRDDLQLCWEGLTAAVPTDSSAALAVASLPLDAPHAAARSSLYSFPTVEQAWEAHVSRALRASTEARDGPRDGTVGEWSLRKLAASPRPDAATLDAVLEAEERHQFIRDDPSLSGAERLMHAFTQDAGLALLEPRTASYLLCVRRRSEPRTEPSPPTEWQEAYVLRLHAPRVLSRHAVVVCAALPTHAVLTSASSTPASCAPLPLPQADAAGAAAAAALQGAYTIAPHMPSLWVPRDVGGRGSSGVYARAGRLLVHVPSGEARYADVRLAPVLSQSFTTLGSVRVWTAATASPVSSSCVAPSGTVQHSAVWTLVGDGRSAAGYLEDAVREYTYDTGARSLRNVGQGSRHEQQPGLLVVRRKPKARHGGAASSPMGAQEVCAAWLDVGTARRLLLTVRDVGVGEVLVCESSLVGPHAEVQGREEPRGGGSDTPMAALAAVSRAEEAALEAWVAGITAGAVPKHRR